MDTGVEECQCERKNANENIDYDASLDFTSEFFDPLKALLTPGVCPPVIAAEPYDNLAKYESETEATAERSKRREPKAGTSNAATPPPIRERRWLPHQLPIKSTRTHHLKNIFTRMETIAGPLAVLKKCKDERIRIKVWTRHSHNFRGYCTGFVTVFDKHWNIVLEDVTEIWTRLKKRKVPANLGTLPTPSTSNRKRLVPPPVKVIKCDKKTETCERHVDRLLIRGEQIVMVIVFPIASDKP